jgi:hypothetical protein
MMARAKPEGHVETIFRAARHQKHGQQGVQSVTAAAKKMREVQHLQVMVQALYRSRKGFGKIACV